jgi:hypothetical protein
MAVDAKRMAEIVGIARDAVAGLEEPLKTEGFKILLEKLLGGGGSAGDRVPAKRIEDDSPPPKVPKGKKVKKDKKSAPVASTLNLGVGELTKLKTYCARFELQGTEQIAFVLANFAREHTDLECVTAGDVVYLHRQLISQRLKVAAVNDPADWTRALQWLTAPSRRKEWLIKSGAGFAVSNSGLLRWQEMEEELKTKAASQQPK